MRSTQRPGTYTKYQAPLDPTNSHRRFILAAGYTAHTGLEFGHHTPWFRTVAGVVEVNHSEVGFDIAAEVRSIWGYLEDPLVTEVYFVGLSMGAQLALEVLCQSGDELRLYSKIKGILPISGISSYKDPYGLSPKLWPLMVWPITAPWFIHKQNNKEDPKHPKPTPEWDMTAHHRAAIAYGENVTGHVRRMQARFIAGLMAPPAGAYAHLGIPMVYLAAKDDKVVRTEQAARAWINAFGDMGKAIWMYSGLVGHCSLNTHPYTFARYLGQIFKDWGVPLEYADFDPQPLEP